MENNWYLNTMQFGVEVIYRAFKLMALFVYLWGVQICEQCAGWPGASSCPSNANNTHSLSPCPTLDDLHVNRYLSRGRACAAPPPAHRRTFRHTMRLSSQTHTSAHVGSQRYAFISRKPQSFARRQMAAYLSVTPKRENTPLVHHMMIFLQRYPVDWSSVHILH